MHENFLSFEENDLWSRIKLIRFLKKWLDGSSDDRAIALDDVPVAEFRALLDYFYHECVFPFNGLLDTMLSRLCSGSRRTRNFTREAEIGYLQDLLAVSTRIKMVTIFEYASKRLENLQPPLSPHKRILLCQQYSLKLSTWLYPAVAELLEQVEPLNIDEAQQVGLELFQKIAAMREDLRQFRNEDGTFLFARGELTWYASNHLQWGTEDTLSAPLPAHRRITQ